MSSGDLQNTLYKSATMQMREISSCVPRAMSFWKEETEQRERKRMLNILLLRVGFVFFNAIFFESLCGNARLPFLECSTLRYTNYDSLSYSSFRFVVDEMLSAWLSLWMERPGKATLQASSRRAEPTKKCIPGMP